jgi:hypothetical protein
MRLTIIALVLWAASAHAAPWSIEVPPGYTERPGAADDRLAELRAQPDIVSIDAQVYLSADQTVQLTRMTWQLRMDEKPTRGALVKLDHGIVQGAAGQASKHISDSRRFVGDQLVAASADEIGANRAEVRRLYSVDSSGIVHILMVICAGPADQLGPCRTTQRSMRLVIPNAASLRAASEETDSAYEAGYKVGQILGTLLVLAALFLGIRYLSRRRKRPSPLA